MTAALREACAGLARELPRAEALIGAPDREGRAAVTLPAKASRPPWNAAAAYAALDPHTGIRRLHAMLHAEVTGQPLTHVPSASRATGMHIRTTAALGVNASHASTQDATWQITGYVTVIRQLPANDDDERFLKVSGVACYHCGNTMLRLGERSARVACLRYGACFDCKGNHPTGFVSAGPAGAMVAWADGCNQYADVEGR